MDVNLIHAYGGNGLVIKADRIEISASLSSRQSGGSITCYFHDINPQESDFFRNLLFPHGTMVVGDFRTEITDVDLHYSDNLGNYYVIRGGFGN